VGLPRNRGGIDDPRNVLDGEARRVTMGRRTDVRPEVTVKHHALLCVSFFLLASCERDVRSTTFAEYPPRDPNHPILVFAHNMPECPSVEVGEVTSRTQPTSDVRIEAIRKRAREMGGDAVVNLTWSDGGSEGTAEGTGTAMPGAALSATVIRFTDPDCQQNQ
jgi:hypothetical protein